MTKDEFADYWCPARACVSTQDENADGYTASAKLATLLGYDYPRDGSWHDIVFTSELRNILMGIAGPYKETMIHIYQIRKGLR